MRSYDGSSPSLRVNPLYVGTPISTGYKTYPKEIDAAVCQSPIYRDTHFYKKVQAKLFIPLYKCQSPIYRDTHFYDEIRYALRVWSGLCQSPIYRDTHFYLITVV